MLEDQAWEQGNLLGPARLRGLGAKGQFRCDIARYSIGYRAGGPWGGRGKTIRMANPLSCGILRNGVFLQTGYTGVQIGTASGTERCHTGVRIEEGKVE